jgi:TonB family protein
MVRDLSVGTVLTVVLVCTSPCLFAQQAPAVSKEQASREVRAAFEAGLKLSKEGKFEAAILEYKKALAIDPEQAFVLANLADTLARLNKDDEAVAAYEKAIRLKPGKAALYRNCGILLVKMGKGTESLEMFKKAAAINPSGAGRDFYILSATLANQGKCEESAKAFQEAIAADPGYGRYGYFEMPPCKGTSLQIKPKQSTESLQVVNDDVAPPHGTPMWTDESHVVLVHRVEPVYPPEAKRARLSGKVLLWVIVNEYGDVWNVGVLNGQQPFAGAALNAGRQWKYQPIIVGGARVSVILGVRIWFPPDQGQKVRGIAPNLAKSPVLQRE